MNEVLEAIKERNSCRNFSCEPISDSQIDALVRAALAAPSGMNLQPWHVIVVTDKALLTEMDNYAMEMLKAQNEAVYQRMADRGGTVFYNAPCLIVIAKAHDSADTDCGIMSQNIALAAHSMGLGNVICGIARVIFDGAKGSEFAKRIQIPEGYKFGLSVCVGTAISGKEPHELDMQKVTYI